MSERSSGSRIGMATVAARVPREQVGGQADALAAEDQDGGTRVGDLLEWPGAAGGEEERRPQRRQRALEVGPARPDRRVDARPVVEPGAPNLLVVEREAERPDQVKLRADGQAGAPRVAGVPVDLRLDEHDVKIAHRGCAPPARSWYSPGARSRGSSIVAEADAAEAEHVAAERGEDPRGPRGTRRRRW